MKAPNPENYTLGKGVLYFNKKDPATGKYLGERDMGNAPEVSFSIDLEKLAHYSSRGGISAKDKEIIRQATPMVNFTLDEPNVDNMAMLLLASILTVNQVAGNGSVEGEAYEGTRLKLDHRMVGANVLAITNASGAFDIGEIITGGTSLATATVWGTTATALIIGPVTGGPFQAAETITGGTSLETADVTAAEVFTSGYVGVSNSGETTWYSQGTDFSLSTLLKDPQIGRVFFPTGTTITSGTTVKVHYMYADYDYKKIIGLGETSIEGIFRFVSDNPEGIQMELEAWRVSLTPDGDTALIGEEWSTMSFAGELLKDEAGHPDSPYLNVYMPDEA